MPYSTEAQSGSPFQVVIDCRSYTASAPGLTLRDAARSSGCGAFAMIETRSAR